MRARDELHECVIGWHKSEDSLYGSVLQAPDLYTSCVRLVRAVADSLSDVNEVDALLGAYQQADPETVATIADAMDLPRREFLDYDLVLDSAFYIRYQEIVDAKSCSEMQAKVDAARSEGAECVVLYDNKTRSRGHTFFERLEMRLSDGFGLRTGSELDWEKGRVYVVEPVSLDPENGQLRRGVPPPEPSQQFATEGEMLAAVDALRSKYSKGSSTSKTERGAPNG